MNLYHHSARHLFLYILCVKKKERKKKGEGEGEGGEGEGVDGMEKGGGGINKEIGG